MLRSLNHHLLEIWNTNLTVDFISKLDDRGKPWWEVLNFKFTNWSKQNHRTVWPICMEVLAMPHELQTKKITACCSHSTSNLKTKIHLKSSEVLDIVFATPGIMFLIRKCRPFPNILWMHLCGRDQQRVNLIAKGVLLAVLQNQSFATIWLTICTLLIFFSCCSIGCYIFSTPKDHVTKYRWAEVYSYDIWLVLTLILLPVLYTILFYYTHCKVKVSFLSLCFQPGMRNCIVCTILLDAKSLPVLKKQQPLSSLYLSNWYSTSTKWAIEVFLSVVKAAL